VLLEGVGAEGVHCAGSLILMPVIFFLTTFFSFGDGAGEEAALRLPARVLEESAPELPVAALPSQHEEPGPRPVLSE
jgi:hypothetical protein